jgi:hypothetical protein
MRGGVKHLLVIIPGGPGVSSQFFGFFWASRLRPGDIHRPAVVPGTVKFCKLFWALDFIFRFPLYCNDLPLVGFCNFQGAISVICIWSVTDQKQFEKW